MTDGSNADRRARRRRLGGVAAAIVAAAAVAAIAAQLAAVGRPDLAALTLAAELGAAVAAAVLRGRTFFQSVARDVSARKDAEDAARRTEIKFQTAFQAARFGVVLVDHEGSVLEHNRAAGELLGWGDELTGKNVHDLGHPDTAGQALQQIRRLAAGDLEEYAEERRMVRRDGTLLDVFVRATAVHDEAGRFLYAMGVYDDVTEKKRLQAQLVMSDRLAAVGTLAAGVAHEINNPLACVLANVRFVREALAGGAGDEAELAAALGEAQEGAERVRAIVRDLSASARVDETLERTEDLGQVVRSAATLAYNEVKRRARLETALPPLPPVAGAPHRLGQVFVNLLVNAAQAIPPGRALENEVRVTAAVAGEHVVVEVSDTGEGIDDASRGRLFDPFFTTRPAGVGTGLGLSVCHAIVTAAGGHIEVRSERGRGAAFRVFLPVRGAAAAEAARPIAEVA